QSGRHGSGVLPGLSTAGTALKGTHDRGTTSSLHRDHAWPVRVDPAERLHFVKALPHADQACATPGGVDDHVRQFPIELLGEFVPHGFLALDAVRLFERREAKPAVCVTPCCDASPGVGNQPVHQLNMGAVNLALDDTRTWHIA